MEIIFEKIAKKHTKPHSKKARKNTPLKREIQEVLRRHKVKNMRHHLKHMEGSGLFDSIVGAVSKGVKFYNDHKETIHKVANAVVKHAPKALELYKKVRGGARSAGARSAGSESNLAERGKRVLPPALKEWHTKCKEYASQHGCTYKEAMTALKKK